MKRICKTHIHQRGFTMIELVVVLIIMAIIATFILARATPGSNDLIAQTEILKSHLRYAQIRAMNDTVPWGIFFPDNSHYILYKDNAKATISQLPGETAQPDKDAQTRKLPTGITVTTVVGSTPYNFDAWGSPGTSTLTITLSQGATTNSITITKNTGYIP